MNETKEQKIGIMSFILLLYCKIFGTEIKPITIKLDKNESYKKSEHDPIINTIIYLSDLLTNYCLPYRLSPIIISIPGLIFNIILLISVYTSSQLYRYHYILWFISRYLTYILDMIDGKQARRNNSQSLARHYWDHWCDTINIAISSMIIIKLYPEYFKYRLPTTVLMSMTPIGFYVNFFRYYCTGELIEPYTLHLWHYVYVLALSIPVIIYDITILDNTDYQVMLATLSAVYTICFISKFIDYIISIVKSSLFSMKLFLMILLSPLIWIFIYRTVTVYQSTSHYSVEIILFRCLAVLVLCNYSMHVHYNQLVNKATSFLTTDSTIFILSLLTLTTNDCHCHIILIITLISIIILINLIQLVTRLRIFIDKYPEIGFPICIVNGNNIKCDKIITNGKNVHVS